MRDERPDDGDSRPPRRKTSPRNSSGSSRRASSSRHTSSVPPRGEFDFIERIRRQELRRDARHNSSALSPQPSALLHPSALLLGIGDDAAVIRSPSSSDTVITADLLVEDVDFRLGRRGTRPGDLGYRALAVSLSDVAAMGARPRFCLLSVGLPEARWRSSFLEEFYAGVRSLAARHDVLIIGGDTSRTPEGVVIDSIVVGEVKRGRAVLRSGARPGDQIFVTGALGGAAAGLRILEGRAAARATRTRAQRRLITRQTKPEPRVEWGALLGERRLATALIDLSDGLSSDLAHLCRESGVGARAYTALLPLDPLLKADAASAEDALSLALNGGEDFELLFTVSPRNVARLPAEVCGVPATRIGEITGARGKLRIIQDGSESALKPGGFEHFK